MATDKLTLQAALGVASSETVSSCAVTFCGIALHSQNIQNNFKITQPYFGQHSLWHFPKARAAKIKITRSFCSML